MGRNGEDGEQEDPDTVVAGDDPVASSPDWEARLKAARLQREKSLARRKGAPAPPKATIDAETAVSLDRRLEAARTARARALEARTTLPRHSPPIAGSGRALAQALRHGAPSTDAETPEREAGSPRHASLYAVVAALVVIAAGLLGAALAPRTDPLPDLSDIDLVVIGGEAGTRDLPFDGAEPDRRPSAFPIARTSVQYFHRADAAAAEHLARLVGGEPIDLSGLRPPPPEGRLVVYLADGGA